MLISGENDPVGDMGKGVRRVFDKLNKTGHDVKLKEVASALRLSSSKVRTRLKRANAILQESLKEWYYDEEA